MQNIYFERLLITQKENPQHTFIVYKQTTFPLYFLKFKSLFFQTTKITRPSPDYEVKP